MNTLFLRHMLRALIVPDTVLRHGSDSSGLAWQNVHPQAGSQRERSQHAAQIEEMRRDIAQLRGQQATAQSDAASTALQAERLRDEGTQLRSQHVSQVHRQNAVLHHLCVGGGGGGAILGETAGNMLHCHALLWETAIYIECD